MYWIKVFNKGDKGFKPFVDSYRHMATQLKVNDGRKITISEWRSRVIIYVEDCPRLN